MTEFTIGNLYKIKYTKTSYNEIFKLVEIHNTTLNHQILYTFTDNDGIKIMFTNGIVKNGKIIINKCEEEQKDNLHISIPIMLPNQDKNLINAETSLDNPIKLQRVNAFTSSNKYKNINAYLSDVLDDHDIYG